ncbi:unnamed protein product [Soboliphyme baturini]|uniref:Glyco_trans_2-like domain-containing protein n=1 Tax=Soboliphyme baturini TaxID=241478 RepID=A0A183IDJ7_9BILA|nr:unnamed protein product [Soboliphyme baturini]
MAFFVTRRLWRPKNNVLCLAFTFFSSVWVITTVVILRLQENYQGAWYTVGRARRESDRSPGVTAAPGVQAIVGYYEGALPGSKQVTFTQEELNINQYSPVPGMGEMGRPVKMNAVEEVRSMKLFAINQFNIVASDLMAVNRSLPDVRHQDCRKLTYDTDLPSASVIIVFHNEAWSTLIRTVMSVINRSPRHLLREIILIDDDSKREFLNQTLDAYVSQLSVLTKVLRSRQRIGLVKARLMGAKNATGQVLIFLDSHCECTTGWIEPLLLRIKQDRTAVVCPVIDVINDKTFQFQKGIETYRGGFNWHLQFRWYSPSSSTIEKLEKDSTAPMK